METDMAESRDGGSPPSLSRRACDQCRLRKIRCDKETPCSNCRSARRSCSSTGAGQKPKEPRQRVLISSQYERKIDQIEDRLSGIETLLQQLVSARISVPSIEAFDPPSGQDGIVPGSRRMRGGGVPSTVGTPSATSGRRTRDMSASEKTGGDSSTTTIFDREEVGVDIESFEGNSSLAAHTAFASEFLADAVRKTTLCDGGGSQTINAKFDAALNSLRQIVDMQNRHQQRSTNKVWSSGPSFTNPVPEDEDSPRSSGGKSMPRTNLRDLPLPDVELVREQLHDMSHGPVPVMLAILYTFIDYEHFADRCRQLYFSTDEASEATFLTVNAGLTYIFFEASLTAADDAARKARYEECRAMARKNFEIALAQLNMMMPATAENIEALLMAACYCIDESRASVAWILVSRAAHMCRTLGYHQIHSMRNDKPQTKADKSLLFWCTYMLDKALSLRLGRASVLQDYDISLPHVTPDAKAAYPGKEVITLWIQHARVLGRIYERLYSPGALRQPSASRVEQVRSLAAEQQHILAATRGLIAEFADATEGEARVFFLTLKSDEVSLLSSLALSYRALPPDGGDSRTFSSECVSHARAAISCHLEATALMAHHQSLIIVYIHWTILYAPFIPFIVIFCLVIETSDSADLARLEAFVKSLEIACEVSASVKKLHQLCNTLYTVAALYVEAKAALPMGGSNEFDVYLSQLGFMPVDEGLLGLEQTGGVVGLDGVGDGRGVLGGVDGGVLQANANSLEDWFSGKNYMMGLLEEDLSGIDPMGWPS
ncbi:hypothetical protein F4808DRAFT_452749 [Astrocystis sublimbata]|nr:hypothetical protein F4808DRAFT_452749 [Astrocystis sublimbata]